MIPGTIWAGKISPPYFILRGVFLKNNDKDILIDCILSAVGRFLCLFVAGCVVCGAVQSCSVPACAAEPETESQRFLDLLDTEIERFNDAVEIGLAVGEIIPDGVGTAAAIMQTYLLMNSYEYYQMKYFEDTSNSSSSYTVPTDLGLSGVYRLENGGIIYPCSIFTSGGSSGIVVSSPNFSIDYSIDDTYSISTSTFRNGNEYLGISFYSNSYFYVTLRNSYNDSVTQRIAEYNYSINKYSTNAIFGITSGIPVVNPSTLLTYYNQTVCGLGIIDALPAGEIDRNEPWEYYNEELLPKLQTVSGDNPTISDLLPWGGAQYVPGHTQDPTEPERLPVATAPRSAPGIPYVPGTPTEIPIEIDTNGTTEIYEVYSPTKNQVTINGVAFIFGAGFAGAAGAAGAANGTVTVNGIPFDLPAFDLDIDGYDISIPDSNSISFGDILFTINPDGSISVGDLTLSLPVGVPETVSPSEQYYVVEYVLPTFETVYIPDATIPDINLSEFSNGISMIWESVFDFLDNSGALPLVYITFGISVVGYALWKIGG